MNVVMIGAGYVGLVSGACFAEFGANVTCIDVDVTKIAALERGEMPIYEPGLEDLVARSVSDGQLKFSTTYEPAVSEADLIFHRRRHPLAAWRWSRGSLLRIRRRPRDRAASAPAIP